MRPNKCILAEQRGCRQQGMKLLMMAGLLRNMGRGSACHRHRLQNEFADGGCKRWWSNLNRTINRAVVLFQVYANVFNFKRALLFTHQFKNCICCLFSVFLERRCLQLWVMHTFSTPRLSFNVMPLVQISIGHHEVEVKHASSYLLQFQFVRNE